MCIRAVSGQLEEVGRPKHLPHAHKILARGGVVSSRQACVPQAHRDQEDERTVSVLRGRERQSRPRRLSIASFHGIQRQSIARVSSAGY